MAFALAHRLVPLSRGFDRRTVVDVPGVAGVDRRNECGGLVKEGSYFYAATSKLSRETRLAVRTGRSTI
jgi:hypothetical protein